MESPDALSESVISKARDDVAALVAEGRWTLGDDAALEQQLARATFDALRAPRLAERSVRLRKIARRTIPRPLRPKLRRALARAERVYEAIRDRRESA
ncbi:MAG: hypothetical protein WB770_02155 [Acidimicrobiales bacterium]